MIKKCRHLAIPAILFLAVQTAAAQTATAQSSQPDAPAQPKIKSAKDTSASDTPPKKSWFDKHVIIGQSLSTIAIDNTQAPAQFQATYPKHDTASYLANIGVSVLLLGTNSLQLRATGEWHRNTMTDSAQNNAQIGFTLLKLFATDHLLQHGLMADAKYVYDGINITNSLAAELYYLPYIDGHHFNLNAQTRITKDWRWSAFVAPYLGGQLQHTFASTTDSAKGTIFRPVFSGSATLSWNHAQPSGLQLQAPTHPIIAFTVAYTGRWDAGNGTKIHEGYTDLFQASLQYFVITKPVKISVGPSFQTGSDPLGGLKQQQYWQFAVNISKFLAK